MIREKYYIEIEIRNQDGSVIRDEEGNKVLSLNHTTSLTAEGEDMTETVKAMFDYEYRKLRAFMPTHKINISASVFNTISGSFMLMYSFYGDEKRFVKHT